MKEVGALGTLYIYFTSYYNTEMDSTSGNYYSPTHHNNTKMDSASHDHYSPTHHNDSKSSTWTERENRPELRRLHTPTSGLKLFRVIE